MRAWPGKHRRRRASGRPRRQREARARTDQDELATLVKSCWQREALLGRGQEELDVVRHERRPGEELGESEGDVEGVDLDVDDLLGMRRTCGQREQGTVRAATPLSRRNVLRANPPGPDDPNPLLRRPQRSSPMAPRPHVGTGSTLARAPLSSAPSICRVGFATASVRTLKVLTAGCSQQQKRQGAKATAKSVMGSDGKCRRRHFCARDIPIPAPAMSNATFLILVYGMAHGTC